ncbi:unnamed protein product [Thlaspi arvense]|uniref:Zinc knuckle CX2CX4HX4C domain-containing protein n=1 Tax=Thlaspi arvense TaxID=13288 RepID=A0AAU9SDJ8_THLAR|nr:unnamed protein product [Thlaspi arvense]
MSGGPCVVTKKSMNSLTEIPRRSGISKTRRRLEKEDDDIIEIPDFDNSDLVEQYRHTLVAHERGGRVQVFINGDKPLQFERRAKFKNGDIIKVTLRYEDLHRWCYTCKKISHEEGTCPELTEEQRERNRKARIEQKEQEELTAREMFLVKTGPDAGGSSSRRPIKSRKATSNQERDNISREARPPYSGNRDLREDLQGKREDRSKEVWSRIDPHINDCIPRYRERFHPYSKGYNEQNNSRYSTLSKPKIEWRPTRNGEGSGEKDIEQNRERKELRLWNRYQGEHISPSDSQRTISDVPEQQSNPTLSRHRRPEIQHRETEEERECKLKAKHR